MYININTKQYPISEQEIRAAFPNTSFSMLFQCPEGYALVFNAPMPNYNPLIEYVQEVAPILTAKGTWEQQWQVIKRYNSQTEEEAIIAANNAAILTNIKTEIIKQTQYNLDKFAQTRGYDNILSACTYVGSNNTKFANEGQYCTLARDNTWTKVLSILAEADSLVRPMPGSFQDIEAELPVLEWPN